eukprot:1998454-Rhodomonas_salina.1
MPTRNPALGASRAKTLREIARLHTLGTSLILRATMLLQRDLCHAYTATSLQELAVCTITVTRLRVTRDSGISAFKVGAVRSRLYKDRGCTEAEHPRLRRAAD